MKLLSLNITSWKFFLHQKIKLSHPCILWLFLLCPVSCSICYGINAWSWVDKCLVPWRTHVESWNSALSARPNDGIHLLFYGHSWSSVAPIWPKAHILSLLFHLFLPHPFHWPSWFLFFLLFPISHFLFLIVQQPFLNAFYSPSSFSILSLSGLRGSLPWCSFYGLQPQAPNLRWSGCMCFKRG